VEARNVSDHDVSRVVLRSYVLSGTSGSGATTWQEDWVWANGTLLATVSADPDVGTRYYTVDHLGTPRLVTGTCGTTVAQHAYYAFGLEVQPVTQDGERIRYTGQETDQQGTSGQTDDLVNMHARAYNPNIARFLAADLLRGDPHHPQTFNLFAYVGGNPSNFTDPLGLEKAEKEVKCPPGVEGPCFAGETTVNGGGWSWLWTFLFGRPGGGGGRDGGDVGGGGATSAGSCPPGITLEACEMMRIRQETESRRQMRLLPPCSAFPSKSKGDALDLPTSNPAGLGTYARATHPLDYAVASGAMFVTSGVHATLGGGLLYLGCFADLTPAWPISCPAAIFVAAVTLPTAGATGYAGYYLTENYTLPEMGIDEGGCDPYD
jgi:RHS repeat-associated protein